MKKTRQIKIRLAILVAGELFLQRREFCEGRIRIDRPVALAGCSAGGVLTVRRARVALVAAALVTPAEIAALVAAAAITLIAIAAFIAITVALIAITLEFFARLSLSRRPSLSRPLPSKRSRGGR